jgi:HAD superfamily phosphatase (TIGR01668 family)
LYAVSIDIRLDILTRLDKLHQLTDVTPQLLQQRNAQAVIFDLDDTLVQENTGLVTEAVIDCMQQISQQGIPVAILTNNFYKTYCQRILQQLYKKRVNVLVVQNAFKPFPYGLKQIQDAFNIPMANMVLIGDGYLTDWLASKISGCQFLHADWFKRPFYKHPALFVVRELLVLAFDVVRFALFGQRPTSTWLLSGLQNTTRQYLFLINPKSGKTDVDTLIGDIQKLMLSHPDCAFYVHVMRRIDKLDTLFKQPIQQGEFTHVVVAGGDGSVREAIRLIIDNNPAVILGILPTGTGNLFAKALNIPLEPKAALQVAVEGAANSVPIMRVNNTYGSLVAGMGLDATIMSLTDSPMKRQWGPLAYVISAVHAINQKRKAVFWISIDGQKSFRRFAQSVMVVQRNEFAKAFLPLDMGPENPAQFDVCILKASRWPEYLEAGFRLVFKQYKGLPQRVEHFYGQKVHVRSLPALPVHVDGDPIPYRHIYAEVLPDGLPVMLPIVSNG